MRMRTVGWLSAVSMLSVACGGPSDATEQPGGDTGPDSQHLETTGDDTQPQDSIEQPDVGTDEVDADTKPGPPVYDLNAAKRLSCGFGVGDHTTISIGPAVPHGKALPFDHVVVLMLENRSFDHYFSKLPEYGVTDVDVAPADATNPDPALKKSQGRFHETRYCIEDCDHNWSAVHLQYDDGLLDGFVSTNNPGGARAMGYYDSTDFPYYYWLAKTFSISDRHFSSLLGPTWPNRFYFYGATSWGRTHTPDTPPLGKAKILNLMEDAGRTWRIYHDGSTSFGIVFGPTYAGTSITSFDSDVDGDKLPDLSIIDPSFSGANEEDEHPPSNVQKGQRFVARIVKKLMSNPTVWKKTVLFITYDEHGGFYDHVAPPAACEPDSDVPPDYKFNRLGFRVPLMVISPFAKAGYVSHTVTDHTSITRFIENRFDLGAMTKRDANAWPMLDLFDFDKPPFATPPTGEPSADPSVAGLDWCAKNPPGTGTP